MFIVLSLENANARLNIAWLLVITLSIWSTIVLDPGSSSRGSPFLERASHHVLMGAWLVAMILLSFHRSLSMVVRYELEAHTSKNELEAARSVLRAVCDVTVELDGAFQLQGESPQLVDMLMLNPKRLLPGEDLRSFLASEKDRQKFSEQMGQAGLPENDFVGLCAAFHVCMKDGSGIPLDVEMFGVGFANRKGEPAYFVGIREFTDTSPLLKDRAAAGLHAGRRGHAQSTPGAREEGAGREVLAQGGAESPHEADAADAAAWIDTRTAGYGVRHATPLFTRHVDTNGLFLSALDQSQRFDFISWVQQAYPALVAGSSSAREEYHERLHLRRPPLAAAGAAPPRRATTSALVQLDLTPPPSEQSCGDGLARLVLWDLRGARGAPRELAGGPAGRPPRARVLGAEREAGGPAPEVVGRERLGSQVGVGHTSVGGA
ncbi:unnamed protein product [Prorocentrum cordatum]|uniref:Uncharacterized protein n=1 Tax=Prorocentrum cordatum TaxID=2364126 RepID=A0ABN9UJG6_9DINO|nr:unnamed protein product [Polarella glacialis]